MHKKECKEISERNKKMICRDCGGTIKDRNEACGGEERGLETRKVLSLATNKLVREDCHEQRKHKSNQCGDKENQVNGDYEFRSSALD